MTDEQEQQPRRITPTLYPGMDYKNGVLYYTAPYEHRYTQKGTKGAPDKLVVTWLSEVIATDPAVNWEYNNEVLTNHDFSIWDAHLTDKDLWSGPPVSAWLNGEDTSTEPLDIWQRVRNIWTTYIDFQSNEVYHDICTLWTMGTYLYKVFESYPYLKFEGTKESGKSQCMRILDVLAFNTMYGSAFTTATIFRTIGSTAGTILMDEFELKPGDPLYEDITGLLRFGYKKGGVVPRHKKDQRTNNEVLIKFPVYCPKAIASINALDEVTASRVIEVTMEPTLRTVPEFVANRSAHQALINDLHYFGLAHAPHVEALYQRWTPEAREVKAPGITNRAWEIAGPIIVMADYIGGESMTAPIIEWLTEFFDTRKKQEDSLSAHRTLVISLPHLMSEDAAYEGGYYLTKDILDNYLKFSDDNKKKTRLSPRVVNKWMNALGFKQTRTGRGGTQVRVDEEQLRHVFEQRQVTPRDEDLQWLSREVDYQTFRESTEPNLSPNEQADLDFALNRD